MFILEDRIFEGALKYFRWVTGNGSIWSLKLSNFSTNPDVLSLNSFFGSGAISVATFLRGPRQVRFSIDLEF